MRSSQSSNPNNNFEKLVKTYLDSEYSKTPAQENKKAKDSEASEVKTKDLAEDSKGLNDYEVLNEKCLKGIRKLREKSSETITIDDDVAYRVYGYKRVDGKLVPNKQPKDNKESKDKTFQDTPMLSSDDPIIITYQYLMAASIILNNSEEKGDEYKAKNLETLKKYKAKNLETLKKLEKLFDATLEELDSAQTYEERVWLARAFHDQAKEILGVDSFQMILARDCAMQITPPVDVCTIVEEDEKGIKKVTAKLTTPIKVAESVFLNQTTDSLPADLSVAIYFFG